ncbi:MAG: glycosyltransferase family 9 protein [Prevotella sp.]|nr:glycosyltransferase family 9 protein [Prevotella sp.]
MRKGVTPRRVLITRFSALGDIAMALPVIYDVCRAYPDTAFYFLTRKHPSRLFINAPSNLTVISIDTKDYKGIAGIWRLFNGLQKKYRFDAVADFHDVLRTKVLRKVARLKGLRVSYIRKGRFERRSLTRRRNKVLLQLRPMPERYRDALKECGFNVPDKFQSIFEGRGADQSCFSAVSKPKRDEEVWIGVAPFARHTGKIYPMELMGEVVAKLANRPNHKIFLFGFGKDENEVLSQWSGPNIINMAANPIGLENELALIACLDVMLSMDSANMHFAGLTGTRTVSIWGATHPYTGFSGRCQRAADIIQLDMPCRPCSVFGNKKCIYGDYPCLSRIPVNTVLERIP